MRHEGKEVYRQRKVNMGKTSPPGAGKSSFDLVERKHQGRPSISGSHLRILKVLGVDEERLLED